ncbi:MAG: DNA (cytosine-5-)-methyltransferase [Candidatus Woesearchaeota archaeon]|nr:MAG: DNA (cytosine-5-)-methyltransferase [Candidatus Woesearchaeota archaeon]
MRVLSLFDGISGGQLALNKAGVEYDEYYASEVDQYAIAVTNHRFPKTAQLGSVTEVSGKSFPEVDLLLGGSPCQGFSIAGKRLNFEDPRSKLFFEYVRILEECKPKYFLLENVKMKKDWQDIITKYLGVEPIEINSSLVSAQNRVRLYWTNIPDVAQPEDRGILLKDIIFDDASEPVLHNIYGGFKEKKPRTFWDKSPTLRTSAGGGHIPSLILTEKALRYMDRRVQDGRTHWDFKHHSDTKDDKSHCVTANFHKGVPYNVLVTEKCIRYFHPVECERLQTLPDNYTEKGVFDGKLKDISKTQRYKMIGNGWNIDTVAHIFGGLKKRP